MIITNEPGYYEDGQFGIRIENCMLVVKADTTYCYAKGVEFLKYEFQNEFFKININQNTSLIIFLFRFEPLTLVPIQREFIDVALLSSEELKWLNDYHRKCEEIIGNELKKSNKLNVYDWLVEQCKPLAQQSIFK